MPPLTATVRLAIGDTQIAKTSLVGSVKYLKALIPIVLTNTIYNRIQYDNRLFNTHTLNNVPYKIFNRQVCSNVALYNVYQWMRDALRDLEKLYMKELYLIVRRKDTLDIIEYYYFTIKYPALGEKRKIISREQIVQTSSQLFETINHLGQQDKLKEENISYAMQIILNDSAPEAYVTKNFVRAKPYVYPKISDTSDNENNLSECIEDGDSDTPDGHNTMGL